MNEYHVVITGKDQQLEAAVAELQKAFEVSLLQRRLETGAGPRNGPDRPADPNDRSRRGTKRPPEGLKRLLS